MNARALLLISLGWPSLLLAATPAVQTLEARVVGVSDGDTITVIDERQVEHHVRLAGIDAPEFGQRFGKRSKQSLARSVMGQPVRIEWTKLDGYGRLVGKVWVSPVDLPCARTGAPDCPKTLDVSRAQLSIGLAWHYKAFADEQTPEDREGYSFEENEARVRRAGLWADPNPVPPWDWRHAPKQ